ncbi:hypothetical protein BJY18_003633 [Amycolatopsis jiangsuensis]|uniref:Uncharacterized protein n=1 Tax=Amycolatopsis jiangsuensis TaxID=1181879 RepID=A0A840IYC8_9PSEU|nr:hypothetical protein [Amycolatopsis jiangsuensis]
MERFARIVIGTPDAHGALLLTAYGGFSNGSLGWQWDY